MNSDHALVYGTQWKKTDWIDMMIEREMSLRGWFDLTISCQCQIQSFVVEVHLFEFSSKTVQSVVVVVFFKIEIFSIFENKCSKFVRRRARSQSS